LSRKDPYEICAICETMHPASEMYDKYVRNAETGLPLRLRICRSCLHPRTTYIQGRMLPAFAFDVPRTLMAALASVLVALNMIFGFIVGGSVGFAVALSGIMIGAGIFAAVAASCIISS
jgi:hypothetical protein